MRETDYIDEQIRAIARKESNALMREARKGMDKWQQRMAEILGWEARVTIEGKDGHAANVALKKINDPTFIDEMHEEASYKSRREEILRQLYALTKWEGKTDQEDNK